MRGNHSSHHHRRRPNSQVPSQESEKYILNSELETKIRRNGVQHAILCWEETAEGTQLVSVREKWSRQEQLGKGSFGTVFKETCRRTADGTSPHVRAVKEIKTRKRSKTNPYRELEAITRFSQPKYRDFFVHCHGWWQTTESLHIAMEYLPLGDLYGYIKHGLPESEVKHITQQLLVGLDHMHRNRFAHRDLKPKNILVADIGPHWWVKISDFGISKRFGENSLLPGPTKQGTVGFMAPEVHGMIKAESDPYLCDIWSLGAVVFQLHTGQLFMRNSAALRLLVTGQVPFPDHALMIRDVSVEAIDFIHNLLSLQPADRPMAYDAMRHDWFRSSVTNDHHNHSNMRPTVIPTPSFLPRTPVAPRVEQPYRLEDPFVKSPHNPPRNPQVSYAQPMFSASNRQPPIIVNNPTTYPNLPCYPAPTPPQDFSPRTNTTEPDEDCASSSETTTATTCSITSSDEYDDPALSTPPTSHHDHSPAPATKPPVMSLPRADPSCTFCAKSYPLSALASGEIAQFHPHCPRYPSTAYVCAPCATAKVIRRVVQLFDQQQSSSAGFSSLAVLLSCDFCGKALIFSGKGAFEQDDEDAGRRRGTGRCQYTHPAFIIAGEEKYGGGHKRNDSCTDSSSALRVPGWFRTCLKSEVQFGCAAVLVGGLLRHKRRPRGEGRAKMCMSCGGRSKDSGCEPGVIGGYCRVGAWIEHWRKSMGMGVVEVDKRADSPIATPREKEQVHRKKSRSGGRESTRSASSSGKVSVPRSGGRNGKPRKKRPSFLQAIFY